MRPSPQRAAINHLSSAHYTPVHPRNHCLKLATEQNNEQILRAVISGVQSQKEVTAYFSSKQLLPFGLAEHLPRRET